jgi:hypothetical protein
MISPKDHLVGSISENDMLGFFLHYFEYSILMFVGNIDFHSFAFQLLLILSYHLLS